MLIGCILCSTPSLDPLSIEWKARLLFVVRVRVTEIMHAHTQQAHWLLSSFRPFEKPDRTAGDRFGVARRRRGMTAREGGEVVVPHLDGDGAREQRAALQPCGGVSRHLVDMAPD